MLIKIQFFDIMRIFFFCSNTFFSFFSLVICAQSEVTLYCPGGCEWSLKWNFYANEPAAAVLSEALLHRSLTMQPEDEALLLRNLSVHHEEKFCCPEAFVCSIKWCFVAHVSVSLAKVKLCSPVLIGRKFIWLKSHLYSNKQYKLKLNFTLRLYVYFSVCFIILLHLTLVMSFNAFEK